jgi:hypothetical protein
MDTSPASPHLVQLADTLWYERRLLEFLLFKLVSANLVLTSGDHRFITPAIAEVERVMEAVRTAETDRNRVLEQCARALQVTAETLTLGYLSEHAPGSLRDDFADHRTGFMELVNEIESLTRENRRLAGVNLGDLRSTLGLTSNLTYDAAGRRGSADQGPTTVDRIL